MQPTDHESGRFSCSAEREGRKEERAWHLSPQRAGTFPQRAGRSRYSMKARITRIVMTLSSVAMIALAGGASLRGF